ncbi:prenyltransferase/squalene oxidase repeat-containing protein [Horticoccus sp. 23ND18S-11]|uniref:prenyltransferase/squalene oxidase repeat-containing protein n=1 Tax=Horticoccus sp. 23ND18S-11 TaxID=3391832 RepID=UPI0039C9DC7A
MTPRSVARSAIAGDPLPGDLQARVAAASRAAMAVLRQERSGTEPGWTGELSASALSTATAVTALTLVARADPTVASAVAGRIERGFAWLLRTQNADGGWGDTTRSFSNISTTTLVWAALGLAPEAIAGRAKSLAAVEGWLTRAAGSLEPEALTAAIERRYGNDRTFSIPILTMCALCGRLGPGRDGWRHVRQLPFEAAVLPQRWYGALQLPVVSYALPALIAIGQVRHGLRPTGNLALRALRNRCRSRTLATLARLQPENGGFLEATPLTSFVTMSLAALGLTSHPVGQRGVAFITASACTDGSWPIDTNLATWVTTLAVQALGGEHLGDDAASVASRRRALCDWIVQQQYRVTHPYTLAAPGGWAWTNLPGGVPDADDTAGALLALAALEPADATVQAAARAGVQWLIDLQNRDGGIPTFCRGWGKLPFDRSSPDLTAHAIRAWITWRSSMPEPMQRRVDAAIAKAVRFLQRTQRVDGAWVPLWFGHQEAPDDENPLYGTSRVVPALRQLQEAGVGLDVSVPLERARHWLVARQHADGGWSAAPGAVASTEETGLAVEALASMWHDVTIEAAGRDALQAALARGAAWLSAAVESGRWREPSPIGFYFAKLWYFERLYPLVFATGALRRVADLSESKQLIAASGA